MTDLSREELERALEDSRAEVEKARAKAQERADLLATMSHEIRTPMNGIIGMAHLLLQEPLEEDQRNLAEIIKKSALALLKLLNDTLDYSKLNAGRLEIEQLDFDLRVTLDEVAMLLQPLAKEKSLEFGYRVAHDVPSRIKGDPGRLRQVLFNLSGNAIKFTDQGSVRIYAQRVEEDDERVVLRFRVTDTGIGMNDEQLARLFEAYSQADATISRRFGGTGLGLSLSRQLVTLMGGEVGVESEAGKGSTFWFRIPFLKQTEAVEEIEQTQVALNDLRVLLVDPSEHLKPALLEALSELALRVDVVDSGEQALASLLDAAQSQAPYRMALVDMDLPDMSGTRLGTSIRGESALHDLRMVLLTNVGRKGDAARAQAIGFSAYLTKPVPAEGLRDALSEAMRRTPPRGAPGEAPIITRHSVAEARRSRVRLLVVEDDRVNQLVFEWALRRQGFAVEMALTGREAVEACTHKHFDLILMDLHMPDMDGYQALQILKDRKELDHTPILAMTADAGHDVRQACLEAGFDDYVSKPVDLEFLSEKVRQWTGAPPAAPAEGADADATTEPMGTTIARKPGDAISVVVQLRPAAPAAAPDLDAEPDAAETFAEADHSATSSADAYEDDEPPIDLERLEESTMGILSLRESLLKTFLAEVHPRLTRVAAAIAARDAELTEFEAHGVKGMAATIGATACARCFAELERMGASGRLDGARPLLERARVMVDRAQAHITELGEISDAA